MIFKSRLSTSTKSICVKSILTFATSDYQHLSRPLSQLSLQSVWKLWRFYCRWLFTWSESMVSHGKYISKAALIRSISTELAICVDFFAAVNVSHKSKASCWLLAKCVENIFQRLQLIINTIQEVEHGGNHSCIQNRLKQIEGHFIWHLLSSTPGFHPLWNVHKIQF